MAQEVTIQVWCDVHLTRDQERVPATYREDVVLGPVRRRVELCEACSEPFLVAAQRALEYGSDTSARKRPVESRATKAEGSGGQCPDPECDYSTDKRANLTSHSRGTHGVSLDVLETRYGLPVSGRRGQYGHQAAA